MTNNNSLHIIFKILFTHYLLLMPCLGQFMVTSRHVNAFRVIGPLCGESTVIGFRSQRANNPRFVVFFDISINKGFNKQSNCWWLPTPWHWLRRHCNAAIDLDMVASLSQGELLQILQETMAKYMGLFCELKVWSLFCLKHGCAVSIRYHFIRSVVTDVTK